MVRLIWFCAQTSACNRAEMLETHDMFPCSMANLMGLLAWFLGSWLHSAVQAPGLRSSWLHRQSSMPRPSGRTSHGHSSRYRHPDLWFLDVWRIWGELGIEEGFHAAPYKDPLRDKNLAPTLGKKNARAHVSIYSDQCSSLRLFVVE